MPGAPELFLGFDGLTDRGLAGSKLAVTTALLAFVIGKVAADMERDGPHCMPKSRDAGPVLPVRLKLTDSSDGKASEWPNGGSKFAALLRMLDCPSAPNKDAGAPPRRPPFERLVRGLPPKPESMDALDNSVSNASLDGSDGNGDEGGAFILPVLAEPRIPFGVVCNPAAKGVPKSEARVEQLSESMLPVLRDSGRPGDSEGVGNAEAVPSFVAPSDAARTGCESD